MFVCLIVQVILIAHLVEDMDTSCLYMYPLFKWTVLLETVSEFLSAI